MPQIERNAPCPCGSGKKYKRCCGINATSGSTASEPPNRKTVWVIAAVALGVIVFFAALAVLYPRPAGRSAASPAGPPSVATTYKEVPGVNLASLTDAQRSQFLQEANTKNCTCSCGYTIAACRHLDTDCQTSLPLAQAMLRDMISGASR
jgi:hypothetical protein